MKIQIASDLHLEFLEQRFPDYRAVTATDADVLVIAGDIHHHAQAIAAFRHWDKPVIYVNGNHECYGSRYDELIGEMRAASRGTPVRYLECEDAVIGGVRFLGCCLWTDYLLDPARKDEAMQEAEKIMIDHRLIRTDHGFFSVSDAESMHQRSRAWLADKLNSPFSGPTVVVTHHAPHPDSIHPRYAGSVLNAAFVSDLSDLVGKADLWIHGHVHDSFDYAVGGTRVVANPRGYALNLKQAETLDQIEWENPNFDPSFTVEIG